MVLRGGNWRPDADPTMVGRGLIWAGAVVAMATLIDQVVRMSRIAVWVTSWMAGLPGGTPRDARECAGRALMAAILAHGIALQVFQTVRYW